MEKFLELPTRPPGGPTCVAYDYVLLVLSLSTDVGPPRVVRDNTLGIDLVPSTIPCSIASVGAYTARLAHVATGQSGVDQRCHERIRRAGVT